MPPFCEVALPVPLDRTFTYAVREGQLPVRGARVIAPFRNEKLIGVCLLYTSDHFSLAPLRGAEARRGELLYHVPKAGDGAPGALVLPGQSVLAGYGDLAST